MTGVAVIGCGKIAQTRHIPEYAANPKAEIKGFYDLNRERAKQLAQRYGGKAYASVEELLSDDGVEAVSVCTANHTHASISIQALKAGRHVLCEKPMATTLEECEEMTAWAQKSAKKLMIGQNQRLAKAHVRAKELLAQGIIGKVISFRTAFAHGGPEKWSIDPGKNSWFFDKKSAAMGVMADLGVHKTDLIQYLLGSRVAETTARLATLDKCYEDGSLIDVDDNAFCIYKMSDGVMGTMRASWTCYGEEENHTVLYGTEGIMKIYEDPSYAIVVVKPDGERICYDIEKIQTNDRQMSSGVIDAFVEAIETDTTPVIDGNSVLWAMKAVFASIRSSEQGKTIKVV